MSDPERPIRPERQAFYDELTPHALAPLWEVLGNLVPRQPATRAVPHAWHYEQVRPLLLKSGGLVTAEEAVRRVLVFENPAFPGQSLINDTLYAGAQLILPGETAPNHKHTAGALRFILESRGGYTTVDGERTSMNRGDLVITPSGAFHDHGHDGDDPVVWIDCLDIPLVNFFGCGFSIEGESDKQAFASQEGHSIARFGSGMLPLVATSPFGATSPVFSYPFEKARAALLALPRSMAADPHFGYALRYANPLDGGWVMPTMAAWLGHLPAGFATAPYRATDNQMVVVAEGRITVDIDGQSVALEENDVMALPGWTQRTISAGSDAILFFCSDRSAQERLGFWREERV